MRSVNLVAAPTKPIGADRLRAAAARKLLHEKLRFVGSNLADSEVRA
jgi:hypothetical protein